MQLSREDRQKLFATLVRLSTALLQARITLTSVDPLGTEDAISYRTTFYEQFTKGVPSANQMNVGNLALQVLALQSGGRVLNGGNDIAGEIARAASDADAFYTLRISPGPRNSGTNTAPSRSAWTGRGLLRGLALATTRNPGNEERGLATPRIGLVRWRELRDQQRGNLNN